ncbi:MAG: ABC transporter ATP-binding protein [Candidatus Bathyarchaeota archaeon]|nr:ABC transporter ATP-binding protein [Candidatus Bathyarchaeota archaeon]
MIELAGVSKIYNGIEALKNINLKVERGEILTILGPNGSGKTTLLKILGALEMPTEGFILSNGVRVDEGNAEETRRTTTLVFQRAVLLRGTVRDNVAYGLRIRNLAGPEIEKRVKAALSLVGLEDLADRPSKGLSGGEQQRCSLARALVLECNLLLLDEPTANLDPESMIIIKQVIKRLSERGVTIVLATHDLKQAQELSERILLLDGGEIVESGRPDDLFLGQSSDMARFTRSENFFSGESRVLEGVARINIGGGVEIHGALSRGGPVNIHVRPEDIIVSNERIVSSARNNLLGSIFRIEDHNSIIRIKVDVGVVFTVQITRRSFEEMGLNVGQEVYLTFKASSVMLL